MPQRATRRRAGAALAASAALAALAGPAAPPAPAAAGYRVTLRVPGHHPKAGRRWPVTVTASYRGRPVHAHLRYEYLFNRKVVSRQSNYAFTGRFTDHGFVWPARSIGVPLTLRAVVSSSHGTRRISYWVRVVR